MRFANEKFFYLLIQFSQIGIILNKKVTSINCSTNSKSFEAIFFFEVQKLKIFEKTSQFLYQFSCVHYSFPTVSWLCLCSFKFICNIRLLQSHMRLKENRPYNHWLKGQGHHLLCFSTSRTVGASSVRL